MCVTKRKEVYIHLHINTHTRVHSLHNNPDKYIYFITAVAATKLLQSCPTLCDPIDGSPPGSPIPGILQARTLEWVAISFSNAWKWKVKIKSLSRVRLLATPRTVAYQAPPSMGFSRQEYWSGLTLPSPIPALVNSIKTSEITFLQLWYYQVIHFITPPENGLQSLPNF